MIKCTKEVRSEHICCRKVERAIEKNNHFDSATKIILYFKGTNKIFGDYLPIIYIYFRHGLKESTSSTLTNHFPLSFQITDYVLHLDCL